MVQLLRYEWKTKVVICGNWNFTEPMKVTTHTAPSLGLGAYFKLFYRLLVVGLLMDVPFMNNRSALYQDAWLCPLQE